MRDPTGSKRALWTLAAGAMFLLAGCSNANQVIGYDFNNLGKPLFRDTKMAGRPRVENCGIIAISTPSTYECNGKKYTSVELADIRAGSPSVPATVQPVVPRSGYQR